MPLRILVFFVSTILVTSCFKEDINKPVINLKGDKHIFIKKGDNYLENGAIAKDDRDGDISNLIKAIGEPDTKLAGQYFTYYNVKDASGNAADEVVREIFVFHTNASLSGIYKVKDPSLFKDSVLYYSTIVASNDDIHSFKLLNIDGKELEMKSQLYGNTKQEVISEPTLKNDTSYTIKAGINGLGNEINLFLIRTNLLNNLSDSLNLKLSQ